MNENRDGIERLRETVDAVARELERRPIAHRAPRRGVPLAFAAAALVVVLLAWLALFRPASNPEVEVLVLKVRGRPVHARVVQGQAPSTIIVMPQPEGLVTPVATTAIAGGMP